MEDVDVKPDHSFWRGRRVLLTGHTGFKGAWLSLWLRRMGAQVVGLSLEPPTQPNLFDLARVGQWLERRPVDIRDEASTRETVLRAEAEIVFHLAAQALVHTSYRDPVGTFATNVQGTVHVLNALRDAPSVRVVVAVTTDKVYRNLETAHPFRETDPLGGHDPYSASKAASEMVIESYRNALLTRGQVAVGTARAGNVIGGGDWAADRLIPDLVRAFSSSRPLEVRRPEAVRPWQHVLEPLAGYLRLAERLWSEPSLSAAYNFGPRSEDAATVRAVVERAREAYGRGEVVWGRGDQGPHEAGWLSLDASRAEEVLGIRPRWRLEEAIERTMAWYREWEAGADALALCERDILGFEGML